MIRWQQFPRNPSAPRRVVETKVVASTGAVPLASAVGMFLVWLLGVVVFGDDYRTAAVEGDGVPVQVVTLVFAAVSTAAVFFAGYRAPHTFRADLDADEIATPLLPREVE